MEMNEGRNLALTGGAFIPLIVGILLKDSKVFPFKVVALIAWIIWYGMEMVVIVSWLKQSPRCQALLSEGDSGEEAKSNLCDTCSKKGDCNYLGVPMYHCTKYEVSEPEFPSGVGGSQIAP